METSSIPIKKMQLSGNYVYLGVDYPNKELVEIGSYPDGWMEGNLELPEYPSMEFVPTLVSYKIYL